MSAVYEILREEEASPRFFPDRYFQPFPKNAWSLRPHSTASSPGHDQRTASHGPIEHDGKLLCKEDGKNGNIGCNRRMEHHSDIKTRQLFDLQRQGKQDR